MNEDPTTATERQHRRELNGRGAGKRRLQIRGRLYYPAAFGGAALLVIGAGWSDLNMLVGASLALLGVLITTAAGILVYER